MFFFLLYVVCSLIFFSCIYPSVSNISTSF
jgi:hypothetical protein